METGTAQWSSFKRFAFRAAFIYLVLYILPFPFDVIPQFSDAIDAAYLNTWRAIVVPVGRLVFRVDITVLPAGSGDTTFNYVQLFCYAIVALIGAIAWTLLDRGRRPHYARLNAWLRAYVRLALCFAMVVYGSIKVFQSQFPPPSMDRLMQPLGQFSPMGLLWTFMGFSRAYNAFTGAIELIGGLLLMSRRTALLGALVSAAALSNVVVLNFCFDVPVKLYSMHLLAMALFLLAPHTRTLASVFVLNRAVVHAQPLPRLIRNIWLHRTAVALRTIGVIAFAGFWLYRARLDQLEYISAAQSVSSALRGVWNVDDFTASDPAAPRWRRLVLDSYAFRIFFDDDTNDRYFLQATNDPNRFELATSPDDHSSALTFQSVSPDHVDVDGSIAGRHVHARMARSKLEFPLTNRGFHWINEYPVNR